MRPARALIDLQALRHNYQLAREVTGAKALAVIKADAYGHGAVPVAQALEAEPGLDAAHRDCVREILKAGRQLLQVMNDALACGHNDGSGDAAPPEVKAEA